MPRITISYRRDDSGIITGRIFDRLVARYGRETIFRDIDDVPYGVDFRTHIDDVLASTDVIVSIVGPYWAGPSASQSRLSNEADPVRVEIETALRLKVPLIPVLVLGGAMPTVTQLPESLKEFAYRNAVQLDAGQDFDVHMARLIRAVDGVLGRTTVAEGPPADRPAALSDAVPGRRSGILITGAVGAVLAAILIVSRMHFDLNRQLSSPPSNTPSVVANPQATGGSAAVTGARPQAIVRSATLIRRIAAGSSDAFSADGRLLALASYDIPHKKSYVLLWDTLSDHMVRTLAGNSFTVNAVALSPDAKLLASISADNIIRLWDATTGELQRTILSEPGWLSSVAFSRDGKTLAVGGTQRIGLWSMPNGQLIRYLEPTHAVSLAFSPDGRVLASSGSDIKLWDFASGRLLRALPGHTNTITAIAFSPDGHILASGSDDKTIKIWDVPTGGLLRTLINENQTVDAVAFSPDGRTIASGSKKTIRFWDPATGQLLGSIATYDNYIPSIAFSPNAPIIAINGELWRLSSEVSDATADSLKAELALWKSIADSSYASDFNDYLHKYPKGQFAEAAINRLIPLLAAQVPLPKPDAPIEDGDVFSTTMVCETWEQMARPMLENYRRRNPIKYSNDCFRRGELKVGITNRNVPQAVPDCGDCRIVEVRIIGSGTAGYAINPF